MFWVFSYSEETNNELETIYCTSIENYYNCNYFWIKAQLLCVCALVGPSPQLGEKAKVPNSLHTCLAMQWMLSFCTKMNWRLYITLLSPTSNIQWRLLSFDRIDLKFGHILSENSKINWKEHNDSLLLSFHVIDKRAREQSTSHNHQGSTKDTMI